MRSTHSLLSTLQQDFPSVSFVAGAQFHWSPATKTITYARDNDTAALLHEVAHADLEHTHYNYDIELLKIEREAWEHALLRLAPQYGVYIDEEKVESMLTTYRDWLHNRSLCPDCEATGIQQDALLYACLACGGQWRVNEARSCALRRYRVPQNTRPNK